MPIRLAVGDVMTRNFVSVAPKTSLYKCAKELIKQRVDSLLITDKEKLIGIITSRDILWAIIKNHNLDLKDMEVLDIATRKVAVIKPSADISQALSKMKKYGFRRLPVISKGKVIGMLTLKDILRVDPSLYEHLGELSDIREESDKLKKAFGFQKELYESPGFCEECNAFSELLKVEGRLLCEDCREELY